MGVRGGEQVILISLSFSLSSVPVISILSGLRECAAHFIFVTPSCTQQQQSRGARELTFGPIKWWRGEEVRGRGDKPISLLSSVRR